MNRCSGGPGRYPMLHYSTRRRHAATTVLSFSVLLGAALLAATSTSFASTPTTGAWIFPTSHRTDAVADSLADTFYTADSSDAWLQDSFFADSQADSASVSIDLYNPTSAQLFNVQIFAAYSVDDLSLVNSINFSGGDSGDLSYSGTDLQSGGTPQMAGGVAIDTHDVYPAYFVSYGVGNLAAGASNIRTIMIDVSGDFAGGLIVHLDYTAEDASGTGVSGPFEADMNIFENGEAPPACEPPTLTLTAVNFGKSPIAGSNLTITYAANASDWEVQAKGRVVSADEEASSPVDGATVELQDADATIADGERVVRVNITFALSPLLLAGDTVQVGALLTGEACGETLTASSSINVKVGGTAGGHAHSAAWWEEQAEKTKQGNKKAEFSKADFELLLERAALHSSVFAWGPWSGDSPSGGTDSGSVDIGSLAKAMKVLDKETSESKKVRGAEAQDLALWLNVAAGALNLDSSLEIRERHQHSRSAHSDFGDHVGMNTLPSAYDTPGEVLAFLEKQIKDWQDGQGASKIDLKLARRLAKAVNQEWLVLA